MDVKTSENIDTGLSLPRDLVQLEHAVREVDAALILLDPLMSRLDAALDTHKDAEVRQALEPLTALADRSGAAVLGLIHVNKGTSSDPLTLLMGSRAFAAVARAVLFVMTDPDDEETRLLGQPKNNLGRTDLPTLTFRIESAKVADTSEGPVWTGRVRWTDERQQSIREALESVSESSDVRSVWQEAAGWLTDYLTLAGEPVPSKDVKIAGKGEGFTEPTLKRAASRLKVHVETRSLPKRPRVTYWSLPTASRLSPGESEPIDLTEPIEPTELVVGSIGSVGSVSAAPPSSCADCGQRLLLAAPGRTRCERCRRAKVGAA